MLYKPFVSTSGAPLAPDGGPLQLSSSAGIAIAAASFAPPPRRRQGRLPVASGRGLLPWRLSAGAAMDRLSHCRAHRTGFAWMQAQCILVTTCARIHGRWPTVAVGCRWAWWKLAMRPSILSTSVFAVSGCLQKLNWVPPQVFVLRLTTFRCFGFAKGGNLPIILARPMHPYCLCIHIPP